MIDVRRPAAAAAAGKHSADSGESAAVRIKDLTKQFGALRAVDALSLDIRRGETVALLGPNGAGKTTTISMLLGLLAPDAGEISVLGMAPTQAVQSGRIGAMLQEGSLMPGVRVGELLDYVLGLCASPMPRERMLAMTGLQGLERRRVDRLSGGQTQRVRFALAIASQSEVLVLDEPTAAMDVEARHAFWASMRDYTDAGRTVLFATHYLEEAEAFASRVVVIAHGRIVADGTVADLRRSFGMPTVQFRSPVDGSQAFDVLAGVFEVQRQGEQVTLKTTDTDSTIRDLTASAIAWHGIEIHGPTLDDVFLTLVGEAQTGEDQ
ncbi:MAG TPA: ABC transporter ATP-binding protein [Ktedonobacterales bacterium]|nr:ABC transporter ATP-binding protein [Ktedonobacterales bacterium]